MTAAMSAAAEWLCSEALFHALLLLTLIVLLLLPRLAWTGTRHSEQLFRPLTLLNEGFSREAAVKRNEAGAAPAPRVADRGGNDADAGEAKNDATSMLTSISTHAANDSATDNSSHVGKGMNTADSSLAPVQASVAHAPRRMCSLSDVEPAVPQPLRGAYAKRVRDDWTFAADIVNADWATHYRIERKPGKQPNLAVGTRTGATARIGSKTAESTVADAETANLSDDFVEQLLALPFHLRSRLSHGMINLRASEHVRGHASSSPHESPAPPSATTELRFEPISRARLHGISSNRLTRFKQGSACEAPVGRLVFTAMSPHGRAKSGKPASRARQSLQVGAAAAGSSTGAAVDGNAVALTVKADGSIGTMPVADCMRDGKLACAFELLAISTSTSDETDAAVGDAESEKEGGDGGGGGSSNTSSISSWLALRSALSGGYVRLCHAQMPTAASWEGLQPPFAARKPLRSGEQERKVHREPSGEEREGEGLGGRGARSWQRDSATRPSPAAMSPRHCGRCPLLSRGGAPTDWEYNCSIWAPLINQSLSRWAAGGISAAALDLAFRKEFYPGERAHATPGAHVSVQGGRTFIRTNSDYRMELLTDMLRAVSRLVRLPDVEFVAHLWDHPKVPRSQPLPILAHYGDEAHSDVPMPAPWSWDDKAHNWPQPYTKTRGCAKPWEARQSVLYFRGGCNGPTRGWRGPLWRFYARKRTNRLSKAYPGQIDAGTYDHCDSPKLNKHEWGWDAQMEIEMWAEGPKRKIEGFRQNCEYKYLLHVDGNVASSRMASELHLGSTIFKQDSFSNEYFYPLLRPWEHYVPVSFSLDDVPQRLAWAKANPAQAAAIGQRGKAFAQKHLHKHSIACFWWQLLSALAELEDFEPRHSASLGFRPL